MKINAVKAILKVTNEIFPVLSSFFKSNLGTSQYNRCSHTHLLNMCFAKTGTMNATLYLKAPTYFYPYFPHLLSDMSKIKHFPFLRPTPYNDSEPPSSYSWTLLPPDYHLEGPRDGKGWGQWCYKNCTLWYVQYVHIWGTICSELTEKNRNLNFLLL